MLYLCATPIGNLEDITLRVRRILQEADVVYAEDTRHTLALFNHLGIKNRLVSCHEHNERLRTEEVLELLRQGKDVAVVSDAGMPGISDPGALLAAAAAREGLPFTVLPGPSASVTALVLSALPCERFVFEGFLPREKKPRRERLELLKKEERTTILYESPYRLRDTLEELFKELGDRPAAVCRELTKVYEECIRGTLGSLIEHYEQAPKGECVLILGGAQKQQAQEADEEELIRRMSRLIAEGEKPKSAAKKAAEGSAQSASDLYNAYQRRKEQQ